ncbi:hypothetical protein CPLU01_09638 [Colletotrichum plurivorum]|uniref:Rhodopsin domain-containing protein n=1 Tax=Colletotrichum plurivorum TaxID=2175906 RepID=A0A8H6K8N6_9PEZI|nr:hypothetical protein CPLU01_09638 [Colletotrichum plurivorum]
MSSVEDGGPPGLAPHGKAVIACSVVTAGLAGIIVGLRFFARLWPARLLGYEDWCIFTAWLFSAATTVGMYLQVRTGMGEHFDSLSLYQQQTFFKWSYLTIIFYNIGLALVKTSILLLYLRVLRDLNYRKACYIVLSIVVAVSLWTIMSSILFCVPIERNWDKSVAGHCLNLGAHWFTNAGINIATDFMILILPLPILPKIRQTRQQRISLYLIFALGFFVCIVSILRIPSLIVARNSTDTTVDSPGIAQWSVIELNTAIVCACLITLKPLATRFCPRILGATTKEADRPRGAGSDENEAVPATVGSKESGHPKPQISRGASEASTIYLNHDTFGGRSATETRVSRASIVEIPLPDLPDLEMGIKPIPLEENPTHKS